MVSRQPARIKQIVYGSGQFGGRELCVIDVDGSGRRRLTDFAGAIRWLGRLPDPIAWLPARGR